MLSASTRAELRVFRHGNPRAIGADVGLVKGQETTAWKDNKGNTNGSVQSAIGVVLRVMATDDDGKRQLMASN